MLAAGRAISDDAWAAMVSFAELLRTTAVPRGFVSAEDAPRVFERHVVDSLRAAVVFTDADTQAADLGSGAGLPGIPLAIALPGVRFVLVEPRPGRAAFLELAIERLQLANADVRVGRAEALPTSFADVVTTRALAPVERSWELARPALRDGGRLVYFGGAGSRAPAGLPGARSISLAAAPLLATSGPLIIIGR
jgi:16S rRNA (guanine527-N7)-methyltransferase